MLRITKEADYAILLLGYIASRPDGEIHTARQASRWSGLPLPMVSKILRGLAREKVLASQRGAGGGYRLERSPADTSVAQVIRALEGPISFVQCGSEPGACGQEPICPTRDHWARISRAVERTLERIPISAMIPQRRSAAGLLRVVDGRTPGGAGQERR